jgi:hypothetical protein
METTMWTKHKSSGFMPGMPMTFHLAPPVDRESTQPALEHGTIKSITWNESYRPKPVEASPPPAVVDCPHGSIRCWVPSWQSASLSL